MSKNLKLHKRIEALEADHASPEDREIYLVGVNPDGSKTEPVLLVSIVDGLVIYPDEV